MSITAHREGTTIDGVAVDPDDSVSAESASWAQPPVGAPRAKVPTAGPGDASTVRRPSGVAKALGRVALGFIARGVTTLLLTTAVAAFLFLAVGPRIFGYQTSTMLTGSMSPLINPGDVVVTTKIPVADLKVGDVVTYSIPVDDHRIETHRVIEILSRPDGTSAIRTKGDANNGADPWTATLAEQTIDKQVFTVPYLGDAIRALRAPEVRTVLMYGAPALLVVLLLVNIWKRPARRPAVPE